MLYLEQLMGKMSELLESPARELRELAFSVIATAASAAGTRVPLYESLTRALLEPY
jgi:hypothetical protein